MNLAQWARLLGWLTIETTAIVAAAAVLDLLFRSPRAGRTLWRAALASVAMVWIFELSGLRGKVPGSTPNQNHYVLKRVTMRSSVRQATPDDRRGEAAIVPAPVSIRPAASWPGLIWLTGSVLLVARFCMARVWLAARRRAATPADENSLELIERWEGSFGLRNVEVQVWPGLRSPVAFGVLRPAIALPPDFIVRFTSFEREATLAHELAHLAAHDPFWLNASDAIIALAWWHPLIWWARRQLQFANESVADEASALIPGGARALAECLVRLGRELTASDPVRALGVGGMGMRSHLAARIGRLLREPRPWRASSTRARCVLHASAIFSAAACAAVPIQTGLSGSILTVFAIPAPDRADAPSPPQWPSLVSHQTSNSPAIPPVADVPPASVLDSKPLAPKVTVPKSASNETDTPGSDANAQSQPKLLAVANVTPPIAPVVVTLSDAAQTAPAANPVLHDGETNSRPSVSLTVSLIITENESDAIGLDWIFGRAPTDNPPLEVSRDSTALRASPRINGQRLVIDRFHTQGQSAILKPEQFAALCDRIVRKWDILTAPVCVTGSGLRAHIAVQKLLEVVTDVNVDTGSGGTGIRIGYTTDEVPLGPAVDILPIREEDGRWRLRVSASETEFIGYDKDGKSQGSVSAPGGKPLEYQIPNPHFRAVEINSDDVLPLGQTLALRGPLWTEVTKTKGRFLSPAKTITARRRLYVFVTPTQPPAPTSKN
jgi:beta-lactamase regulating signal transducer with metallopeptidase domain